MSVSVKNCSEGLDSSSQETKAYVTPSAGILETQVACLTRACPATSD